jgi:Homeodomain-like domain
MRSIEQVRHVLALVHDGLNDREIARRTGIPRGTVRDWRQGRTPRRGPHGARIPPDQSCPTCGHPRHDSAALPQRDYAYLLGLYLGDGCISAASRGVFRLRITLDSKYPGIITECSAAMGSVMPSSKVGVLKHKHQNSVEVSSFSRAWPCLFPQHGSGRKHDRRIRLSPWQETIVQPESRALLRGLIHSDGCHSINTIRHPKKTYVYPRYLFSNRSDDIRQIFCEACDRLGIDWRRMNATDISIARRDSIAMMDEFVGPKT